MSEDSVILFIIETGVIHLGWGTWTANEELGTCNQRLVTGRSKWACSFHNRRTVRQTMVPWRNWTHTDEKDMQQRSSLHHDIGFITITLEALHIEEVFGAICRLLPSLVIGGGLADEYTVENARESCGSSWIAHKDRIEDRTWVPLYDVEQRRGVYVSLSHFTHLKRLVCKSVQSLLPFWTRPFLFEAFDCLLVDNTS